MHDPLHIVSRGRELRIGGLGDSLTYGWMVGRGFFDCFCDALGKRYPESPPVRFNEGIPGDTARGGLSRLPALLAREPHLVLVQFGLNDMFCGVPHTAYAGSLADIVDETLQAGVQPWLVVSCPLADQREEALARPYYDAIRDLGHRRGVPVADLDSYWRERASPATDGGRLFLEDGVHPDDAGHAVMAEGLLALWDREAGG